MERLGVRNSACKHHRYSVSSRISAGHRKQSVTQSQVQHELYQIHVGNIVAGSSFDAPARRETSRVSQDKTIGLTNRFNVLDRDIGAIHRSHAATHDHSMHRQSLTLWNCARCEDLDLMHHSVCFARNKLNSHAVH